MTAHPHIHRWYQEWFDDVLKFFGRQGRSPADAQDLAQEVYLRLLRAENLAVVNHPRAYVHKIASNVLAEWAVRSPQLKPHSPDGLEELRDPAEPFDEIDAAQRQQILRSGIAALPRLLRATLVLHCQEALTYSEIAQRLNVSERMVKRYLKKAYAQLRASVEGPQERVR